MLWFYTSVEKRIPECELWWYFLHTNSTSQNTPLFVINCVNLNKLTGTVGRPLQMQCPYPPQHKGNRKFLCKGDQRYTCNTVVTSQGANLRFTLQDGVTLSSFSVTITKLRADDSGMYWCGSDTEWSTGDYVKIQLSVGKIMSFNAVERFVSASYTQV